MVWEQAHKFDPAAGSPMAWLMTIAHRRAVDRVRAEHRGTAREVAWGRKNYCLDFDDAAETAIDRVEAELVVKCLGELTALQRESIDLAFYRCLTYSQVAERLGVPLPTVKTRIRDGLRRLKICLEQGTS